LKRTPKKGWSTQNTTEKPDPRGKRAATSTRAGGSGRRRAPKGENAFVSTGRQRRPPRNQPKPDNPQKGGKEGCVEFRLKKNGLRAHSASKGRHRRPARPFDPYNWEEQKKKSSVNTDRAGKKQLGQVRKEGLETNVEWEEAVSGRRADRFREGNGPRDLDGEHSTNRHEKPSSETGRKSG